MTSSKRDYVSRWLTVVGITATIIMFYLNPDSAWFGLFVAVTGVSLAIAPPGLNGEQLWQVMMALTVFIFAILVAFVGLLFMFATLSSKSA